jgi:WD40 repeat protein
MMLDNKAYEYRVGGSLPEHAPSYVTREADQSFYYGLKSGNFCYVFNSRQMGKTSLLVRTLHRLRSEGVSCTTIDVSGRGSGDIQPEQWYAGIVYTLIKDFQLANPLQFIKTWWQEREFLDPAQRLAEVIETILLPNTTEQIVIFIDEIDSILSLNFSTDDFFALIRSCYDKRSNNPDYQRLTFALIGVAKPSDLIEDKRRTPFNIGQAIELTGFTLEEATPLGTGLKSFTDNSQKVLAEILQWTGGQPFLTQKLCFLLVQSGVSVPSGAEKSIVEKLVKDVVIDDWESKDNPPHFKTISTRLTSNEKRSGSLLGLYQQILNQTAVIMADRPEERELQLAGIVVNYGDELRAANQIYGEIFNRSWVDKQLADLRPYASAVKEWLESGKKDESRLLRGKALEDALDWSKGKNLSNLDSQFLSACREQRIQEATQAVLQQRIKQLWILSVIASLLAGSALFFGLQARSEKEKSQIAEIRTKNALNQALIKADTSKNSLETLIGTLEATKLFQEQKQFFNQTDREKLQQITEANLQYAIYDTLERNRLDHDSTVTGASYSANGKFIASVSQDKMLKLWQANGQRIRTIPHPEALQNVAISADSQKIATVGKDSEVRIWNTQGERVYPSLEIRQEKDQFNRVAITPDSKYIAATTDSGAKDSEVIIWSVESGRIIKVLKFPYANSELVGRTHTFRDLKFSVDGQFLAGASTDNTIKVWNWKTDKEAQILTGHKDWVYSLSFSKSNKWMVSGSGGSDKSMKIWEFKRGLLKLKKTVEKVHESGFYVAFNPNSSQLATMRGVSVKIWDFDQIIAQSKKTLVTDDLSGILLTSIEGKTSENKSIEYSPDGNRIIVSGANFQVSILEPERALKRNIGVSELMLLKVVYSRTGKYIATSGADNTVRIWQADGALLKIIAGHKDWIYGLSFSPDEQSIASASEDNTVKIWKVADGSLIHTLKHDNFAYDVSFSPDGKHLASVGNDGKLKIWDPKNGALVREFDIVNNDHWVWKVAFSPDSKYLANTTSSGIEIRETNSFSIIKILNDANKEIKTIHNIDFSHDSKMIAASSIDGNARVWDIQSNSLPFRYNAHNGTDDDIKFSPDDQELVTTGDDGTVKFWSHTGKLRRSIEGLGASSLAFSPDAKTFVTASTRGIMRFWDLGKLEREYLPIDQSYEKGIARLQEFCNQPKDECSNLIPSKKQ